MQDREYLTGQLLIAMPGMRDSRFARTVIYVCAHHPDGAMGLVINRLVGAITFPDLLTQLGIGPPAVDDEIRVHFGGPVESGRGFVLHSGEYIAAGSGPRRKLLALGYAGWGPGQLDSEIQANGWLHVAPDEDLVFDDALDSKWERAIGKLGVDVSMLSGDAGHA